MDTQILEKTKKYVFKRFAFLLGRKFLVGFVLFLGICLSLYIFMYKTLQNGIYIKKADFYGIKIDEFYLKLNNKLDLDIANLNIAEFLQKDSDENMDVEEINTMLRHSIRVMDYFSSFNIKNIDIGDESSNFIRYDGKSYLINFANIYSNLNIHIEDSSSIHMEIVETYLPKFDLSISGNLYYKGDDKKIEYDLVLSPLIKQITKESNFNDAKSSTPISISGWSDFKTLHIGAENLSLSSIEDYKKYIDMADSKTLNTWLYEYIEFENLHIHSLSVDVILNEKKFKKSLSQSMKVHASLDNAKVKLFDNMTSKILANKVNLNLQNDSLKISFDAPMLEEIALEDTQVFLNDLISQPINPLIQIRSKNAFISPHLAEILDHYRVSLPLTQSKNIKSKLNVALDIDIKFSDDYKDEDVALNGSIKSKNTSFLLGGNSINASDVNLEFKSDKKSKTLEIKELGVKFADMLDSNIYGKLDFESMKMDGFADVKYINITMPKINALKDKPKDINATDATTKKIIETIKEDSKGIEIPLFDMANKKIAFNLNLKTAIDSNTSTKLLSLPEFHTNIIFDDTNIISNENISAIAAYSPILEYFDVKKGSADIFTNDFATFWLNGKISDLNYPLYNKNGQKQTSLDVKGSINDDEINIQSNDERIIFNQKNNRLKISLKDYDVNADEILSSQIPIIMAINSENNATLTQDEAKAQSEFLREKRRFERLNKIAPSITYVSATNLNVKFAGYSIPTHKIDLSVRDGQVRSSAEYGNGIANVDIINGITSIKINNFSSEFINQIWNKKIFEGGLFDFTGTMAKKELRGKVTLQNTIFKDFAIVQNVLGLIDAVPSLIVFKKPGLGSNGYEIKSGEILLAMNQTHLGLEKVNLIGSSIDIQGNGIIEIESKKINMLLKAYTIKSVTDILSKIPIVGYLVLGDDGKISTNIILSGTLDDPKSSISLLEDTIKAPFNILRRVFTPIDILVDSIKNN